ncbi:MAG: hypothetical protein ABFS41_18260 [Myxococcota bacterium]
MKPEPSQVLERVMQALLTEIGPAVQPGYRQATVTMQAMLLAMTREEMDRAAARRVEENAALRALFAKGAPLVPDAALRARLSDAAGEEDTSLLVPDLEAANQALRALLIELHTAVEALDGDDARALEAAIWRELAASTERRKLSVAPF